MFILINKDTKKQTCFTSIAKNIADYSIVLTLMDGNKQAYKFCSDKQMNARLEDIAGQTYVELNLDIVKLSNITSTTRTDENNTHSIVYILDSGTKIVETFDREKERDDKFNSLLTLNVGGSTPSGGGTKNYNDLENKPSINGVELVGNTPVSKLGIKTSEIINDSGYVKKDTSDLTNYYVKDDLYNRDEIDAKISTGSGIPVLSGTYQNPIIADSLSFGVYVISGIVQSTNRNTTTANVTMSMYSVWPEEDRTMLWEEKKGDIAQQYYFFYKEIGKEPDSGRSIGNLEEVVNELIGSSTIDGGEIR